MDVTPVKNAVDGVWRALLARPREVHVLPEVPSQEAFDDLLPRLQFHFPRGWDIHLYGPHREPRTRPYHLADYGDRFRGRLSFHRRAPGAITSAMRYGGVLLNAPTGSFPLGRFLQYAPNVAPIDRSEVEMETFWIAKLQTQGRAKAARESRGRLMRYIRKLPRRKKAYLLCTGPSLSRFAEFDFSDGYVIGCNSVVSNPALMKHARPEFIVASDPIFHFGPSIYAEQFRRDLAAAAREYPFLFLTLGVYHHLLGPHVELSRERICEVPHTIDTGTDKLTARWAVPRTANIMTMFMLPLAHTIAKEIHIIGADGREPGETYFWKHDPSSQLTDKMQAIKDCHPAFFERRDYVDYYDTHCDIVQKQVSQIEREGGRVFSLTPSFIPALRDRPSR